MAKSVVMGQCRKCGQLAPVTKHGICDPCWKKELKKSMTDSIIDDKTWNKIRRKHTSYERQYHEQIKIAREQEIDGSACMYNWEDICGADEK
jgi:hypothetical protein